jgi:hypothetical protein
MRNQTARVSKSLMEPPPLFSGRAADVSCWRKNAYIRARAARFAGGADKRTKVSMSRLAKTIDDWEISTG